MQREADAYFLNASNEHRAPAPVRRRHLWRHHPLAERPDRQPGQHLDPRGAHLRRLHFAALRQRHPGRYPRHDRRDPDHDNPLWIGGNSPYGEYFQGLIDEVRVYNRALTQTEIQADMNAPVPGP